MPIAEETTGGQRAHQGHDQGHHGDGHLVGRAHALADGDGHGTKDGAGGPGGEEAGEDHGAHAALDGGGLHVHGCVHHAHADAVERNGGDEGGDVWADSHGQATAHQDTQASHQRGGGIFKLSELFRGHRTQRGEHADHADDHCEQAICGLELRANGG